MKRSELWWMIWRNLKARTSGRGLSVMTFISVAGVTLGVASLVVVMSVMAGFRGSMLGRLMDGEPHAQILAQNRAAGFSLVQHPLATLKEQFPEAVAAEAFTKGDVVLKHGKYISSAVLYGVDAAASEHLWAFSGAMIEGTVQSIGETHAPLISFDKTDGRWPGLILGESLAIELNLEVGERLTVISPQSMSSGQLGSTISRDYVVSGIYGTGSSKYDSKWAVVSLPEGRRFLPDYDESLDEEQYVSGVAMNIENPLQVAKLKGRLEAFDGLELETWEDVNHALLFALELERYTMGSILMLIVLVAAFAISGTMMMTVYYRRKQVCLLRAIGMSQKKVRQLFIGQGLAIGLVGIALGMLLGIGICIALDVFEFMEMPSGSYRTRKVPVSYQPLEYLVIGIVAWIFSVIAALYPAHEAAKEEPVRGLRV